MGEDSQQTNNLWLIVGLGNPGPRYAATRHNAGFMAVDELVRRHNIRFSGKQANAEVAKGSVNGVPVVLAKPLTYMNNSGLAVGWIARYYKTPHERVLVVHDDIALPLGKLRIRTKGSDGGHNGLTSLIQHLGTQKFPRLRIGVDRPVATDHSQIDWVVGRFTKEERKVMDEALPRAAEAIEAVLRDGIDWAMNVYNTDPTTDDRRQTTDDKKDDGRRTTDDKKDDGRRTTDDKNHSSLLARDIASIVRRLSSVVRPDDPKDSAE